MSPVTVAVDDEGRAVVSSRETAFKVRNLRRTGRGWLCVFPDEFYGRWIQIEGLVSVVSLPEAMEPLMDYYRRLSGEHPDWDDYRAAMEREQRCLIRFDLTRAGPDRAGGAKPPPAPDDPRPSRPGDRRREQAAATDAACSAVAAFPGRPRRSRPAGRSWPATPP